MPTRVTLAVLAEKIDNMHEKIESLSTEIKPEVKANTEFRLQFKGFIAAIVMITGIISASITTGVAKIIELFGGS